jgi:hypothetical protein
VLSSSACKKLLAGAAGLILHEGQPSLWNGDDTQWGFVVKKVYPAKTGSFIDEG